MMTGAALAAAITMVTLCVALGNVPLAACTTKLKLPAVVGVPPKTPLVMLNVRPVGTVPLATDQAMGAVPLAVKVRL